MTLDSVKVLTINIAGVGIWLFLHLVLARLLSVEHYGIYVVGLSWLAILLVVVQLGFNTSTVRIVSENRGLEDYAGVRGIFRFSGRVVSLMSLMIVGSGLVIIWILRDSMSEVQVATLGFMLPTVFAMSLMYQRAYFLHGLMSIVPAQAVVDLGRPLALLIACSIIAYLGYGRADLLMAATLVITCATALVISMMASKRLNEIAASTVESTTQARAWLSVSLPYLGIGALTVVTTQTDVIMLGMLDSSTAAGLYLPALKLAMLITFPLMAIRSRAAPEITASAARGDMNAVGRSLWLVLSNSVVGGVVFAILVIWQRESLLSMFGTEFISAAPVVSILAIGVLASCLTNGAETFFIFGPFERYVLGYFAVVVILNIALNAVLIPSYGMVGAAVATSITLGLKGLIAILFIRRRTGISLLGSRS